MKKFTEQQLMLYLYGEASPILTLAIDKALQEDAALHKEIKTLQRAKKQMENLNKQKASPSKQSIDAVLKYARDTAKKK